MIQKIRAQVELLEPMGATCKIVLDNSTIFIDGTKEKNEVREDNSEAQCTIITTQDVLIKMRNGELNPMSAVMKGLIIIKGNMGLAMKLQTILSEE